MDNYCLNKQAHSARNRLMDTTLCAPPYFSAYWCMCRLVNIITLYDPFGLLWPEQHPNVIGLYLCVGSGPNLTIGYFSINIQKINRVNPLVKIRWLYILRWASQWLDFQVGLQCHLFIPFGQQRVTVLPNSVDVFISGTLKHIDRLNK